MDSDLSYGIVPLRKQKGEWEVFIILREKGFWEFPKGHAEAQETPKEAASRELMEETGLTIANWFPIEPLTIQFFFVHQQKKISKTVFYFLAEVEGILNLAPREVQKGEWVKLSEAPTKLTFANSQELSRKVQSILNTL